MRNEITRKTTTKTLRYIFNADELVKIAREMAEKQKEVEDREAKQQSVSAQLKAEVKMASNEHRVLAGKYRDGSEWRDVECEILFDHKKGLVTTTRLDTGEIIEERAMTAAERQTELPLKAAVDGVMNPDGRGDTTVSHEFVTDGEEERREFVEAMNNDGENWDDSEGVE